MEHEDRLILLCDIIEKFEDFLEERGIDIPNSEKEQEPESASLIYGTDYGELEYAINQVLIAHGLLEKEE